MKRQIKGLLLSPGAKKFVDRIEAAVPLVRKWHRFEYEEHFLRVAQWERMFSGVYSSFAEASAAIPSNRNNSYDNPDSATFLGHKGSIRSSDYPVLFWLERLLPQNPNLLDFGGYLGISYYSFDRLLQYPTNLQWTIYDVPAVVSGGEKLAAEQGRTNLCFTTSFEHAETCSLLLAFGSLQFPERSFAEFLRPLKSRPRHILLNKTPLGPLPTFYTLHNMGPALAPYRIANREEFLQSLADLNYEVIESWENPEFGCSIPFYPDHSLRAFSGMYLRQK
ncbi:MAG TPA: methyltransferase, TIGR04325 family [Acidobacteriaceae bacterium]|nr:methyltransferase, TIGR04325 family [Acidobacteriaceae bacterium]